MDGLSILCRLRSPLCITLLSIAVTAIGNLTVSNADDSVPQDSPGKDTVPLTFSRLIAHEPGELETWELTGIRIQMLTLLRNRGYNVVGAENPLFDIEKSHNAKMVLGGTLSDFHCAPNPLNDTMFCSLTAVWELFDVQKEQVVYQVTTRGSGAIREGEEFKAVHGAALIRRNLNSLMNKPGFNALLKESSKDTAETSPPRAPAPYKACAREPMRLPADLPRVQEAAVLVRLPDGGGGSGFFISPEGLILTAAHVVGDNSAVSVETKAGFTLPATVLQRNRDKDVALLKVEGRDLPCLALSEALPDEGVDIYAVGTPISEVLRFSVSKGIVSGIPTVEKARLIQTDMAINPGNSGGPLLTADGRVVGLVTCKLREAEGIAFAVPTPDMLGAVALIPGEKTDPAVLVVESPPEPKGPYIDAADPIPPDPKEAFIRYAREMRPVRNKIGGGTAMTIIGALGITGGSISLAASNGETPVLAAGASVLSAGVGLLIGGIVLISRGKKEERKIKHRSLRPPLDL